MAIQKTNEKNSQPVNMVKSLKHKERVNVDFKALRVGIEKKTHRAAQLMTSHPKKKNIAMLCTNVGNPFGGDKLSLTGGRTMWRV
ncbi:MAG: hypothetical protein HY014_02485 [Acidobacteria bacterium]|nr:hypothetical protein [Acidobacteriota bacterium]MBI3487017.1 hypothetical protein [Acidobacteriota bacterium]